MTKTTLNALLAGGGLLATWLAVNPNTTTPSNSNVGVLPPTSAAVRSDRRRFEPAGNKTARASWQRAAAAVRAQSVPLRQRQRASGATANSRNDRRAGTTSGRAALTVSVRACFTDKGKRTAIITGDGQLYLVTQGELVAGRYRAIAVDSDAVTLRDDTGAETRLILR